MNTSYIKRNRYSIYETARSRRFFKQNKMTIIDSLRTIIFDSFHQNMVRLFFPQWGNSFYNAIYESLAFLKLKITMNKPNIQTCLHDIINAKKPGCPTLVGLSYFSMSSQRRRLTVVPQCPGPGGVYHTAAGRGSECICILCPKNGVCLVIQAIYRWPKGNFSKSRASLP